jgi:hypothetical protein
MFLTGVLVGTLLGSAVCLAAAMVHLLADEAETAALQPALVPLHLSRLAPVSLN